MKNYFPFRPGEGGSEEGRRSFFSFLIRFFLIFCFFNYGTRFYNGLVTPGGYYVPFFDEHLNYISMLRNSLLWGAHSVLGILGHENSYNHQGFIWIVGGRVLKLSYSCLGIGVYSFWIAYVLTGRGSFKTRVLWLSVGLVSLWIINVSRITLVAQAFSYDWAMPLGIDHHTWFNIVAYVFIFLLIIIHERIAGRNVGVDGPKQ